MDNIRSLCSQIPDKLLQLKRLIMPDFNLWIKQRLLVSHLPVLSCGVPEEPCPEPRREPLEFPHCNTLTLLCVFTSLCHVQGQHSELLHHPAGAAKQTAAPLSPNCTYSFSLSSVYLPLICWAFYTFSFSFTMPEVFLLRRQCRCSKCCLALSF